MKVLIVEDNATIAQGVNKALSAAGSVCDVAQTIREAESFLAGYVYNIVILDLNLPDGYGLDLIPIIQAQNPTGAILVLTAQDSVADRVAGLDSGADDYLVKPFDFQELLARFRVLERRYHGKSQNAQLEFGGILMRAESFEAEIDGHPLKLSRREFMCLKQLLENAETVVTKDQIIDQLYQPDDPPLENAIEVLISRLRKKIHGGAVELKTIRGVGYILMSVSEKLEP